MNNTLRTINDKLSEALLALEEAKGFAEGCGNNVNGSVTRNCIGAAVDAVEHAVWWVKECV